LPLLRSSVDRQIKAMFLMPHVRKSSALRSVGAETKGGDMEACPLGLSGTRPDDTR